MSAGFSPPSRVSRWTVLRSPPITPVAGDTSLATIQSQPLRASFALALSIRCSVSAAKPITSGGRLSRSFEMVARISGFSTSCSGGMPADVFFSFCSPALSTRQSATAAAKIAISAGSEASTCAQHVARGLHVLHGDAGGIVEIDRAGDQDDLGAGRLRRRGNGKALFAGGAVGDVAHRIDRLVGRARR